MAKKEKEVIEVKAKKVEITEVVKSNSIVKVSMKGTTYEVSGDVANALIAAKRAELVK